MTRKIISFLLASLMVQSLVFAQAPAEYYVEEALGELACPNQEEITYIVVLEGDSVLDYRAKNKVGFDSRVALAKVENEQKTAKAMAVELTGFKPEETFCYAINGFTIKGKEEDKDALLALPGVKSVYVDSLLSIVEPVSVEYLDEGETKKDYIDQHLAIGLDTQKTEYDGDGVLVGVIDSEFWTDHDSFKQSPQNPKISKQDVGMLLAENNFKAEALANITTDSVYKSAKIPFAFDYAGEDQETMTNNTVGYHGTHVAGVVAANNDALKGVAPNAQLALAKVSKDGERGVSLQKTLQAVEDMIILDVDVINMSFGILDGFSRGILDEVLDSLEDAGICVVAASGNLYRQGMEFDLGAPSVKNPDYGTVSYPAAHEYALAVASAERPIGVLQKFVLDETGEEISYLGSSHTYTNLRFYQLAKDKSLQYVYCGYGTVSEVEALDLTGKIALIDRGNLSFNDKVVNAQNKGAEAVILVNNQEEYIYVDLSGGNSCTIPTVMVLPQDGEKLKAASQKTVTGCAAIGTMSEFSSWGTTPDLKIKPDISAVGGTVYSAAYGNGYALMRGTSQASPQFAGAMALALQYCAEGINPSMGKKAKKTLAEQLLLSTAVPQKKDGVFVSPRKQGAGLIKVDYATKSPAVLKNSDGKVKIELGEINTNEISFDVTVKNISQSQVTYSLASAIICDNYEEAASNKKIVTDSMNLEDATVTFGSGVDSVTVPKNSEVTFGVRIELNEAEMEEIGEVFENGFFVEGYILLSNPDAPTLSIPFMGFYGDWLKSSVFDGSEYGVSSLIRRLRGSYLYALRADNSQRYYFSSNLGSIVLNRKNMRNIRKLVVSVKDQTGATVFEDTYKDIGKISEPATNYVTGTFMGLDNQRVSLNDGKYTIDYMAYLETDVNDQKPQTLSFDIYIDKSVPYLLDAYIENKEINNITADWFVVESKDDTGASAIPGTYFLDQNSEQISYTKREGNKFYFNTTGYLLPGAKITLQDLALNTVTLPISSQKAYLAGFSQNILKSLGSRAVNVAGNFILDRYTVEVENNELDHMIFVWDENLTPITDAYRIEASK